MKLHHKAAAAILSTGLVFGSVSMIATQSASADAGSCVQQDQTVGSADVLVVQAQRHATKTSKRVKKAKKANKRHHTQATKKRLKKARKVNRKAKATVSTRTIALVLARSAADKCHASVSVSPVTSSSITAQATDAFAGLGLPADQLAQLVDAVTAALGPIDGLTQDQLSEVLGQLSALLQGGASASALTGLLDQITSALTGAGIPAGQLLDPIEGLLSGLAGSGLSANALTDIATQLASALGASGLSDGAVAQVVGQVLGQLGLDTQPTDPTQLVSVVNGTLGTVLTDLGLTTSVPGVTELTSGLQHVLDSLLAAGGGSGLLSGLAPITGGILGLI